MPSHAIRPMRRPTLASPSRLICWPTTASVPPHEIRPRSLAAARRALELDENSAEAHRSLGVRSLAVCFRMAGGDRGISAVARTRPALTGYDLLVWRLPGRDRVFRPGASTTQPRPGARPALAVVPSVQGWTHIFARQFEDALPYLEQVSGLIPASTLPSGFKGKHWSSYSVTTKVLAL